MTTFKTFRNGSDCEDTPEERNPIKKAVESKPKPMAIKKYDSDDEDDYSFNSGEVMII